MNIKLATAIAAALALGGTACATGAAAQAKKAGCFKAGGEATMVSTGLAKFMANAALNNSIKGANAKASGAATMNCKDQGLTVYCIATQRACY